MLAFYKVFSFALSERGEDDCAAAYYCHGKRDAQSSDALLSFKGVLCSERDMNETVGFAFDRPVS